MNIESTRPLILTSCIPFCEYTEIYPFSYWFMLIGSIFVINKYYHKSSYVCVY